MCYVISKLVNILTSIGIIAGLTTHSSLNIFASLIASFKLAFNVSISMISFLPMYIGS